MIFLYVFFQKLFFVDNKIKNCYNELTYANYYCKKSYKF